MFSLRRIDALGQTQAQNDDIDEDGTMAMMLRPRLIKMGETQEQDDTSSHASEQENEV